MSGPYSAIFPKVSCRRLTNPYIISLYEVYKGKGKTIMPQKKPFITLAQAKEIAADIPTPFHLYDEKGIRENARRVNAAFSWNKGFKEYFAVKATPNPTC